MDLAARDCVKSNQSISKLELEDLMSFSLNREEANQS